MKKILLWICCFFLTICLFANEERAAVVFVRTFLEKVNKDQKFTEREELFFMGKQNDIFFALSYSENDFANAVLCNLFMKHKRVFKMPADNWSNVTFAFSNHIHVSQLCGNRRRDVLPISEYLVTVIYNSASNENRHVFCFFLDKKPDTKDFALNVFLSRVDGRPLLEVLGIKSGKVPGVYTLPSP